MSTYSGVTETAQKYYNSKDADEFYYNIWGGEDIHVGIYNSDEEPISNASRRTVERMMDKVAPLSPDQSVVDLGAGYGGAARQIANRFGCNVTCVNLSEVQNERNRKRNQEVGLADKITVIDGSFDSVPGPDGSFDVVWSEDALLHASDRRAVVQEAYRVLKPGGSFVFTDPMQTSDCPPGVLQPVYDRIHLDSLASFEYYTNVAKEIGFTKVEIEDLSQQLTRHYTRVKEELLRRYHEVIELSSQEYVDRMVQGLQYWITAGEKGYLAWGIIQLVK